ERDLPVVRNPADAQMTLMDVAFLRMVISSRANHIVLRRRIEHQGLRPARIPGPRSTGFQIGEQQAGNSLVAQLQGARSVELAQSPEMLGRLLQRPEALEAPTHQATVAPRLGFPQVRDGELPCRFLLGESGLLFRTPGFLQ